MQWLNYHHLLYFWTVVQEGGVSSAARKLRLSQPTISAQVRMLERAIGEPLFAKKGRAHVLTDVGRVVYRYADEIFSVGRELLECFQRPLVRLLRFLEAIEFQPGFARPPTRLAKVYP